ncbi:MAG: hypothetical protein NC191_02680 [Muribaculaceae bacterium]|nr:hypothetical protein [Muribaculaceae bacterium]
MINKVELGSVNINNKPQKQHDVARNMGQPNFTGLGQKLGAAAVKGIQKCEESPMINVAVLDLSTAIVPRSIFETVIGSKKEDKNTETQEKPKRKLNFIGGFEALRREGSGLLINCIIPSYVVYGAAKLLHRPIMGLFNKSNLAKSWANSDAIDKVNSYFNQATGATKEERVFNTLKSMFDNIEGVDGDISNGGLKKFSDIFAGNKEYNKALRKMSQQILSDKPKEGYASDLYRYLVKNSGIAENIRFNGEEKFFSSSLSHLCESAGDILHGAHKEGLITEQGQHVDLSKYISKAKKLVNWKSITGLGIIIPLAIAAQPINRWITHKVAGKKGAPIYNDDKERVLTPEEKKNLTAKKFVAVPLMWATAGLSMLMDRPSLKMFQFKNIFPTMDQARLISAATFSSRLAASEDGNELTESTIRDIATFSSFYFLGDYAAKGIATYLEKHNKDGIKLLNTLTPKKENANILQKLWHWAKHTKIKSTDELSAIANEATHMKARNLRAICQLGNLAFSLLSLGVFIPIYTRTQSNKKEKRLQEKLAQQQPFGGSFTQNLIKQNSEVFKPFFS